MMWVMPMSASSTALATRNMGSPLLRTMTKSSRLALSKLTSPRMRSVNVVAPASGERNRTTVPGPGSTSRSRQNPS